MFKRFCFLFILLLSSLGNTHEKPLKIAFWHSFAGNLGKTLSELCDKFNKTQRDYQIVPIYKGSYPNTLTSYVAAYRANQQPALVQIYEIGTATMLHPEGIIKPVYELMNKYKLAGFENESFLPSLRAYYGDEQGRLMALPFNSSSAVMFYNKNLLKLIGVKSPPKTWPEVAAISKKLIQANLANCGFTTTYPSWIHFETFKQLHGESIFQQPKLSTSAKHQLIYASPALSFHLQRLKAWHQAGIYKYAGRESSATSLFTSGQCAMFLQSSGSFIGLKKLAKFTVGVSSMPYWPQFRKTKSNSAIGGAAIWVSQGFSNNVYRGVAKFFAYLTSVKTQAYWVEHSGYFPVIRDILAIDMGNLKSSKIAYEQVSYPDAENMSVRLGFYAQIRNFNDEQIEAVLSGKSKVNRAIKEAELNANLLVDRFNRY